MTDRPYASTQTSTIFEPIEELSGIALTNDLEVAEGRHPAGSHGTVVLVHGAGEAYLVEFEQPFHALANVDRSSFEPVAGESRADLVAVIAGRRNP